jgi:hypothetical protein
VPLTDHTRTYQPRISPRKPRKRTFRHSLDFDLSHLDETLASALPEHLVARPPPPPLITEEGEKYLIDRIIRKEQRRKPGDETRRTYYLVRWQGYGPNEDTWESAEDLREQVPELLQAFEASLVPSARRC